MSFGLTPSEGREVNEIDLDGCPMNTYERFWLKVNKNGPIPKHRPDLGSCWVWTGATANKYGRFWDGEKLIQAHHFLLGEIPNGLEPDHLCLNTLCVRDSHLEIVNRQVNMLRGNSPSAVNARKVACPLGHEYTAENTYIAGGGKRYCRRCKMIKQRDRRHRQSLGVSP